MSRNISPSEERWAHDFRLNNKNGYCVDCICKLFPVKEQCILCIDAAYQEAAEMAMDYESENGYDHEREEWL